jgi:RND family efflux transporter MFP subunit
MIETGREIQPSRFKLMQTTVFVSRARLLTIGVAGIVLSSCNRAPAPAAPPAPVAEFVVPVQKEVEDWDEFTGRTDAKESVEIRARVSGYLTQVNFKAGAIVKKGDLLFVIDPRPYEADLARADGDFKRAEAQVTLAKADLQRAEQLRNQKVLAQEGYDAKFAASKQADAALASAWGAQETAKLNLEFCRITAPIDGRVSRERVTVGNLIQPSATDAGVLTTIVSIDPIYAYVDADERSILKYQKLAREGKRKSAREGVVNVYLGLQNETGWPHEGYIDFVDNRLDVGTGTLRVRAVFDNKEGYLTPGLFVRIRSPGSDLYPGLLIPDKAIGTDQGSKYVLVVGAENKAEPRPVVLGQLVDGLRVVKEGLKPDDKVIVSGLQSIRPGAVVQPTPVEAKAADAKPKS